ncbi:hypothetical protein AB0K80_28015 [Streptomyces sp. NPDC052682]|uniref:hypothetical protein n=1 Tax=Streptomyces sp. NPDC052682 TaxID=3154954 RepID=UPI0034274C71
MLRITDARTGELVDAAPARRGLTRVEAHVPRLDPTHVRVLLVADLLVRALELGGTPVWALLTADRQEAEVRASAAGLGIRPFEDGRDLAIGPGRAQNLHVVAQGGAAPDGVRIEVAPVEAAAPGTPGTPDAAGHAAGGGDPTALRLALLARPRGTPVRLDAAALDDAGATLARWRRAVAAWAQRPSRPVPDAVRERLRAAWEDDLDVPGLLEVLRRVESDPDMPDGARFETYAYADRLLGVELTRDLGGGA